MSVVPAWVARRPAQCLLAAVLLSSASTLGAGFRMDDYAHYRSAREAGLDLGALGRGYALEARALHDGWLPDAAERFRLTYFRPLVLLYVSAGAFVWDAWAPGFHLVNLLFHGLAAYLVFLLGVELGLHREAAVLGALLFAWFPTNAATVPWISTSGELLATIFALSALLGYLRFAKEGKLALLGVATLGLALSLSSKEYALVLPLALLFCGILYAPAHLRGARVVAPMLLFSGMLAAYWVLRDGAIGDAGLPPSSKYFCPPLEPGCGAFAVRKVLLGLLSLFVFLPPAEGILASFEASRVLPAAGFAVLAALAFVYGNRVGWDRRGLLLLLWPVVFLLPTATFAPAPWHLYVSSAGSCPLIALGLWSAAKSTHPSLRRVGGFSSALLLCAFGALSFAFGIAALGFNLRQEARLETFGEALAEAHEAQRIYFVDMKVLEIDLIQALRMRFPERDLECHVLTVTEWGATPSSVRPLGARSFEVEARGAPFVIDLAWSAPRAPEEQAIEVYPGQRLVLGDYRVRVESVEPGRSERAAPARLRFELDRPLADPRHLFFQMLPDRAAKVDLSSPR